MKYWTQTNLKWLAAGAVVVVAAIAGWMWYAADHHAPVPAAAESGPVEASSTPSSTPTQNTPAIAARKPSGSAASTKAPANTAAAGTIEAQPTLGPVIDPRSLTTNTSGWVTCKNAAYGYEIRYPAAWMAFTYGNDHWSQISKSNCATGQSVTFSANDPLVERISIAVYPAAGAGSIPASALNSTASEPGMSWQETTVSGESALWNATIDVADNTRTDVVDIKSNGNLYIVTYWFCTATTYVNTNEIYFQTMVENMKFI